ncbi:MAG: NusG domain II-containing protein [Clostridia bacterium]|nr:NusG domain II-containing protein [Clostridia bacterium]MBR5769237.1 NusG domain II-containing protein [Clostridia bacterium]MBR5941951.1 NusG domain II-containing protein [Clostridia bacterium]
MKSKLSLQFKKRDFIIIAAALLLAAAVFLFFLPKGETGRLYAEISKNGEVIASLPLDTDAEYVVNGDYENVVTISDGSAFFSSSNCPNEDCVHTGKLTKAGQLAVCLPNGVTLRIVGGEGDVDAIAG